MAFTDIDAGDYRLKNVSLPNVCNGLPDQKLRQLGWPTQFSVKTLCAAIQQKCTVENISWYLQSYVDDSFLQDTMPTEGWPALYYAIERNSPEVMSLLLQHGTNPNTSYKAFKLPVLAFAIFQGHREANDSTEIVRVLLAAGANPQIIPIDMWEQYLETPRRSLAGGSKSRRIASLPSSVYAAWCTSEIRPLIADALYLSQRYLLSVANKLSKPNKRWVQIAKGNKMTDLAKLPYFLIGQRPATNMVMKTVTSHVAIGRQRPLVMAFAGLSGHGKTELARALGGLISVKTTVINCASVTDVWGLFGPTMGWSGYEKGSQLNNFLAQNSSQRSVVFLDEFDKTKKEVRDALLLATEKGEYIDRRHNVTVDCSRTIWVIATNVGDDAISEYYSKHLKKLPEENLAGANLRPLQNTLKRVYRDNFGAPFTGRINLFVPFLPFSKAEAAVVLHKFILQAATKQRQPIDLSPDVKRYVGHCRWKIPKDGEFCIKLAEEHYSWDYGARPLSYAALEVERAVFEADAEMTDEEFTEATNDGPLQEFIVRLDLYGPDNYDINVSAVPQQGPDGGGAVA